MKFLTVAAALSLGVSTSNACLMDTEIQAERTFKTTGVRPVERRSTPNKAAATFPIGTGDRFADATPVGLGVDDRKLESILNVKEATSALDALKKAYPDEVSLFTPPFETFEGRSLPGILIGDSPRVFIMSGIHARERGGPDNVIYFISDLLAARKAGTGLTYGDATYTAEQVETALGAGLVVMPLTNPDGVTYDQESGSCWRKNRNTESGSSGNSVGIDLNRNYDFVWDFEKAFDPSADPASNDPSSETFCGTAAESEPETKAVVWALDQYKNITWFMDLHSYAADILYAWGDDDPGLEPEQNIENPDFDGKRGVTGDKVYKEYLTAEDLKTEEDGTKKMLTAMNKAGQTTYDAYPAVGLYPTSGASNDYAMGRYYGKLNCDSSRMFGLTLEFGAGSSSDPSCPFYPGDDEYHESIRQVGAGFMEMVLLAAGPAGDPVFPQC
ncbi:hypothetical protein N3K66_007825 [Trichothecium roseum]|uniref:Uncharacterized protein n=1 Tax=Trichothecium roseum TaxID=47278 RepID=A0ACC0URT1_9HYPO|nr:hypothetical protein N3K66_007825 [Trichothecium roseum]